MCKFDIYTACFENGRPQPCLESGPRKNGLWIEVAAGSYVESFNVMLADQAYLADWENALETLEEMKTFSISPDVTSYFAAWIENKQSVGFRFLPPGPWMFFPFLGGGQGYK